MKGLIVIISYLELDPFIMFWNPAFRFLVTVQTYGKTKTFAKHDYQLGIGFLVEIPSFPKTKYFARNT